MQDNLMPPFSDIVGDSSPVQQTQKLLWNLFQSSPLPNNRSEKSKLAASMIMLHLLGTMNSIGMINAAGYHSSAITLLRSAEDALDCLSSVAADESMAIKWLDGKLKASDAAKHWTNGKYTDDSSPLSEYRKTVRCGLNEYCHCAPLQTNWNLYLKKSDNHRCTVELNYNHAVININGYYIDRYLCIHLLEIIEVISENYSYYLNKSNNTEKIKCLSNDIQKIIVDFLAENGAKKLYMDTPPELKRIKQ